MTQADALAGRLRRVVPDGSGGWRAGSGWELLYLGANVDAFAEGGKMGIRAGRNVNFPAAVEGVQASWSVVDQKLGHLRRGDRHHLDFSPAERKRMRKEKPGK